MCYLTRRHPTGCAVRVRLEQMTEGGVALWFLLNDLHIFRKWGETMECVSEEWWRCARLGSEKKVYWCKSHSEYQWLKWQWLYIALTSERRIFLSEVWKLWTCYKLNTWIEVNGLVIFTLCARKKEWVVIWFWIYLKIQSCYHVSGTGIENRVRTSQHI